MAFQGEHFAELYGAEATQATPPIRRMIEMGVPVGAGADATRVASCVPWVGLWWMATGKTPGGLPLMGEDDVPSREEALRLWTHGSAWFPGEAEAKGKLAPGIYADLAVLSGDYLAVPPEEIRRIHAVLTVVGGAVVHGEDDFEALAPPLPPASPDWSPVAAVPSPGERHAARAPDTRFARACHDGCASACGLHGHDHGIAWANPIPVKDLKSFWGALGCSCFAV